MRQLAPLALAALCLVPLPAAALQPGDLLVASEGALYAIDPESGEARLFSADPEGAGTEIGGIAVGSDGDVFVSAVSPSRRALGLNAVGLWRTDRHGGDGERLALLAGVASEIGVDRDGRIVARSALRGSNGTLQQIDPQSGLTTAEIVMPLCGFCVVSFFPVPVFSGFGQPLAVDSSGTVWLIWSNGNSGWELVRVDLATQETELLGPILDRAVSALAVEADGSILLGSGTEFFFPFLPDSRVLRFDPQNGSVQLLAEGGLLQRVTGIAIADDGGILVSDGRGRGRIVRIDPDDGSQTLFFEGLGPLDAIAVVPGLRVEIQVAPFGWQRSRASDLVRVALFGSEDLDVESVERRSLRFGPGDARPLTTLSLDLDRDGFRDQLLFFRARAARLGRGEDDACLWGLADGRPIGGCDAPAPPVVSPRRPAPRPGFTSGR